jgi:hypothetical protein
MVKKEGARPPALNVRPTVLGKRSPACVCPDVTGARPRDALILVRPWGLNRPHSAPSNRLVRRIDRDTRATNIVSIAHVTHVAHDYHNKTI